MEDIRKECGMTISALAYGIWNLPDDAFHDLFMELMKLHKVDYDSENWIDQFVEFLKIALNETKPDWEEC